MRGVLKVFTFFCIVIAIAAASTFAIGGVYCSLNRNPECGAIALLVGPLALIFGVIAASTVTEKIFPTVIADHEAITNDRARLAKWFSILLPMFLSTLVLAKTKMPYVALSIFLLGVVLLTVLWKTLKAAP